MEDGSSETAMVATSRSALGLLTRNYVFVTTAVFAIVQLVVHVERSYFEGEAVYAKVARQAVAPEATEQSRIVTVGSH